MVGLEWYPCCRLKHNFSFNMVEFGWVGVVSMLQAEAQLMLQFQCGWVGLGWVGVVTMLQAEAQLQFQCGWVGLEWYPCCRLKHKLCFSLQHGYHSNPTTPKLQHTSNQEQYDQCGNSTE